MATIKDIAQRAGVSIGTVDRVLHKRGMVTELTEKKVNDAIRDLNYTPNHVAQGLAARKKKWKLGFFLPELKGHPFFLDVQSAAVKKAGELEQYGVQVVFRELLSRRLNDSEEKEYCLALLEELDGLAILGVDISLIREIVQGAHRKEIPVVFYNIPLPDVEYLAYVGADYRKAGQLAAGLCALAGGSEARIGVYSEFTEETPMIVSATKSARFTIHDERFQGFRAEIAKRYPGMRIVAKKAIGDNQIDNYLSVQELLNDYPEINIIYVDNPGDYKICEAISKADRAHRVRIITNDLVDTQKEMVRQEIIAATVCQEPEKQGEMPLDILFRYLAHLATPQNKLCYTDLSIHIAQNS